MSIDNLRLQSARDAIRRFLLLPEDDPIDLVFLAAVACNFDPDRQVPIWLVIVGSPSSGKTELAELVRDWKHTWSLPDPLTSGYFLSSRNRNESALLELDRSGKRILYLHDMISLLTAHPKDSGPVYSQLIGIHDGFLHHRTGLTPDALTYGPKEPKDRLGFITTATEKFYGFQESWFQFGSRFTVYYYKAKAEWDDHEHLTKISQLSDVSHWRRYAKEQVHSFLDHVLAHIEEYREVEIEQEDVERLSAAVTLVQRILGTGRSSDPGVRLHRRVLQLVRMFAFLDGRAYVTNADVLVGIKVILSQLPLEEQRILYFAIENPPKSWWMIEDLLEAIGGTRRVYSPRLETLADIRLVRRQGDRGPGYRFQLGEKARTLVRTFDPEELMFAKRAPAPRAKDDED